MRFKAYEIITRAIEEGIDYGYRRAFKHVDKPDEELIKTQIYEAITNALSEVIDWENS